MSSASRKLIEVALPLEAINKAASLEKGNPFLKGHPRNLHQWWARRPLAVARAVIFSQMVDDPSAYVDMLREDRRLHRKAETALRARLKLWEEARTLADKAKGTGLHVPPPGPTPTVDDILADHERQRLFRIIEDLVLWENSTNEIVLQAARDEIWASWRRACLANVDDSNAKDLFDRHKLPAFHDPFAGGGALPLEAQRLGLDSFASDLNPVAVLINKVMIEIPPKFAGRPPVNPESRGDRTLLAKEWRGARGLAEDVRYYAQWIQDQGETRMRHLYPRIEINAAAVAHRPDLSPYLGKALAVVAWLWARTVKSPNPAFAQVDVPLASTFMLATKAGKEAYVEPLIDGRQYRFTVRVGKPTNADSAKRGTKSGGSGSSFVCLMSGTPMPFDYLRREAKAGRMGARLMAVVAETDRGRVYLAPTPEWEAIALSAEPTDVPDTDLPAKALGFRVQEYGMSHWRDLFTARQLVAMTTFSDLVQEVRERVRSDTLEAGVYADSKPLSEGGTGATAYADALTTIEALILDKFADYNNTICTWNPTNQNVGHLFTKQAIPMAWDFPETSPLDGGLSFASIAAGVAKAIEPLPAGPKGLGFQHDCSDALALERSPVISTDPPYYDNIGYADLSDFFYLWLRRSLKPVFPDLFGTLAVPKSEELVATPYRHGTKEKAEAFFLDGMTQAMSRLVDQAHPAFPVSIYYAFKQSESESEAGTASTGWETFLGAVIRAGFAISGTWPMRTEREARSVGQGTNALASSIILICRKQGIGAPTVTRRDFVAALKAELPLAVANLQRGNIAPVDLAQAAIGPGMAVYTRFARVLDAQGKALTVREALALINAALDEVLAEQEGDFDPDTRWALAWFEHVGFGEGEFGIAETLSKAKVTSVQGMKDAGILDKKSPGGKVRLLRPEELPVQWDPATDPRLTAWEIVHHLIRVIGSGGEGAAAQLVMKLGVRAEVARELAYRLYAVCERKKRAADAFAYNGLIQSWPEVARLAQEGAKATAVQGGLFDDMGA